MAAVRLINPPGVHDTAARYAQAVLVEGPHRRLVLSGQIGVRPDGSIADGAEAQMDQLLENMRVILASQGMSPADIIKMTVFMTDAAMIPAWRNRRAAFLQGHLGGSTLLIVAGLASPDLLIEVEAEAVA